MPRKKVLYISGSLGLGHITRDLAIARELRKKNPEIDMSWLAAHPASEFLEEHGEKLVPAADQYANDNIPAEEAARDGRLNLLKYLNKARREWAQNVEVFAEITSREQFDLTIGDETYEIAVALGKNPKLKKAPFVMIYDFIGLDAMTKNPFEKLGIYIWNRTWANVDRRYPFSDLNLFVGEKEDIPDRKFDFLLPNRREWAKARCEFVGYVISFDPVEYADKETIRKKLGYGQEPLIVCSVGGSAAGKPLLELFGQTYPLLRKEIPDLRMILVCGPRIPIDSLDVPSEVEVREYVRDLYEHYAACDLAIVMGGGTTTLELTALRRPFIYFPLEGHCEQELTVAARLERHQAGVRMVYKQTTPKILADKVLSYLGHEVTYASIPTDGAQKAAGLLNQLL
jgi:UDP-N-acetylglucosamine:LPS N-acetylglucosamine transferase